MPTRGKDKRNLGLPSCTLLAISSPSNKTETKTFGLIETIKESGKNRTELTTGY